MRRQGFDLTQLPQAVQRYERDDSLAAIARDSDLSWDCALDRVTGIGV